MTTAENQTPLDDVDQITLDEKPSPVVDIVPPSAPLGLLVDQVPVMEETPEPEKKKPQMERHFATQHFPIVYDKKVKDTEHLDLPGSTETQIRDELNATSNLDLLGTPQAQAWYESLQGSRSVATFKDAFLPTLENETASFQQFVSGNSGAKLAGTYPRYSNSSDKVLSGEKAMLRLESHLGTGDIYQVPLWHSGFWVTFKPPSEAEIVELNRQALSEKYQFGRRSYGMVFSNTTGLRAESYLNLALSHIYQFSFKLPEGEDLRDYISIHDLYTFLWGFICTMYPRGFQYSTPCTADPEKCMHVVTDTLNLTKLQWTNNNALNEWQRHHMSYRTSNSRSAEDVKRYKDELLNSAKKPVVLSKGMSDEIEITLKSASVMEYIQACHRWIDNMVAGIERAMEPTKKEIEEIETFGQEAMESWRENRQRQKENTLVMQANASAMRHYSHMVDSIRYGDDLVIEDRETIENALARITANEKIKDEFYEEVSKYRDGACISLIGIPNYKCPACGQPQKTIDNYPAHTNVIPLDVMNVFFILVRQRLGRISQR